MKRKLQRQYVKVATVGEAFKAFVPTPLPPRPAIDWTSALRGRFDAALLALGRLDAVTDLPPNAALLLTSAREGRNKHSALRRMGGYGSGIAGSR